MSTENKNYNRSILKIGIKNYKSFFNKCEIQIKNLTILSGVNSSGKSSIFQPLLLMKQTLEESYDPGALQLNGQNIKFSNYSQLISKYSESNSFSIEIDYFSKRLDKLTGLEVTYEQKPENVSCDIQSISLFDPLIKRNIGRVKIDERSKLATISKAIKYIDSPFLSFLETKDDDFKSIGIKHRLKRNRCFFEIETYLGEGAREGILSSDSLAVSLEDHLKNIIHLPGLRSNPIRNYPVTSVDFKTMNFPGTFEKYVASLIFHWITVRDEIKLPALKDYLNRLGLASGIGAEHINDTEIALTIKRGSRNEEDSVSIADVGLGVSQTLPILVALLVAKKDQIVYIEQPEIHLHPKAQYELARIFAETIKRGVVLIIETHSSILLRGVQTLVASGEIEQDKVILHWFLRDKETDYSYVESALLDDNGSFGDWPEDFDETTLMVESNYLKAVEERFFQ